MADSKISALPASTTPLAGTEVLPIVQSSTTKQVSVANLTAGRAVSALSVTASTGNFVVGTSGQGIDFSATPGTGTSELLADYEEGTWTPTDASGAGLTLTVNGTQFYTKVGRTVTVSFNITYPATADASFAILGGLPFTSVAMSHQAVIYNSLNLIGTVGGSSTSLILFLTSTYTQPINSQLSTLNVQGTLTYQAA